MVNFEADSESAYRRAVVAPITGSSTTEVTQTSSARKSWKSDMSAASECFPDDSPGVIDNPDTLIFSALMSMGTRPAKANWSALALLVARRA